MSAPTEKTPSHDGVDRRGFLKCMAWAGTGMLWVMKGGILQSRALGDPLDTASADFTFAQISDSHIGFNKGVYTDVVGTFQLTADRLNALPKPPALLLHTGDLSHLSKPAEFDTLSQMIKSIKTGQTFYTPGEHDFFTDNGAEYLSRFGKGTQGAGWQSFNFKGVHFVGLVNVTNIANGASPLGTLGKDQIDWLTKDLAPLGSSTPIVLFAHIPLWTIYEQWGWGTADSAQALALLKRFASVTVLNGHIHQILQKVEGNITFHTARSTAFPQPQPGKADSPGPMKNIAADTLKSYLGMTTVTYLEHPGTLAIADTALTDPTTQPTTQPK